MVAQGSKIHIVRKGECISSIAYRYNLFPETVWNHSGNDDLRETREDPNVLREGDRLFIPGPRQKKVTLETGKRHQFRRKGVPARFRLKILNGDQPRPNIEFELLIDDEIVIEGKTDGDGVLDVSIPADAKKGVLLLDNGNQKIGVSFGRLDPVASEDGIRQRLFNLGLLKDLQAAKSDLVAAVRMFQLIVEIDPTGVVDDETRDKLAETHDIK